MTALALARLDRFDMFHSWWIRILFYELIDYNYYTLCWRFGGQTVGKRILRAKVVRMDGSPLSYWDAVVRYWVWMVGMALAGIGYFWIAWDKEKRGWPYRCRPRRSRRIMLKTRTISRGSGVQTRSIGPVLDRLPD